MVFLTPETNPYRAFLHAAWRNECMHRVQPVRACDRQSAKLYETLQADNLRQRELRHTARNIIAFSGYLASRPRKHAAKCEELLIGTKLDTYA